MAVLFAILVADIAHRAARPADQGGGLAMAMPVSGVRHRDRAPPTRGPRSSGPRRALGRIGRAVRLNRKATVGTVLLAIFILIALFPGVIAHDSPTQDAYAAQLGISTAHLLGTNHYGQDLFAQLVYGTRNVLIIAFVVGLATTAIAVLIGVAAAYLGGLTDSSLSVVTDVLLVIPLFPLLIVIAAYAHGGTTLGADPRDHADQLVLYRAPAQVAGADAAQPGLPRGGAGARRAARCTSSWWSSSPP